MTDAEVEEFIAMNEVDGSAADALRECSRQVQQQVIDRGGLSGARNPSSVLLARIRDASTPPLFDGDPDGIGIVRLRGIPFRATPEEILAFFDGLEPMPQGVIIGTTREGRLSGEAFVQFPTTGLAKQAIERKNRASMGDRYIELFPSNQAEAQRAAHGESRNPGGDHRGPEKSGQYWALDRTVAKEEVETFISQNGVDDAAATALFELPSNMQAAVIDRGGLGNARNPSSVLLSRIRDVQNGTAIPPPPQAVPPRGKADRVEAFLAESQVDGQTAEAFRNCHPDVQEEVMQGGLLDPGRNPSSALRARIRDVENAILGGGSSGGAAPARPSQAPPPQQAAPSVAAAVEDFIYQNGLDERAAEALRTCQPRVQEAVLDRGNLSGTRNPSSAVLSRIRDAQHGPSSSGDRGQPRGYHDDGYGGRGGAPRDGRPQNGLQGVIEDFIRANYLDERAGEALRTCPPYVAEAVLNRGDLSGTRNPSSALLARLKEVQGPLPPGQGKPGPPPPVMQPCAAPAALGVPCALPGNLVDDIEYLLSIYSERDERALDALSRLRSIKYPPVAAYPPYGGGEYFYDPAAYGQRAAGPGHHNLPSPGPYSPRGHRQQSERGRLEDDIANFVRASGIDAKAADALRRADPKAAYMVMEKGVSGARNPSSALLARLRDAESLGGQGRDRGFDEPLPRKQHSRADDAVEAFIRSNGVDEMAADALRRCGPELQEVVMEKGVSGARNPSSALLARIRDLDGRGVGGDRRGYGSAPPRRGGERSMPY